VISDTFGRVERNIEGTVEADLDRMISESETESHFECDAFHEIDAFEKRLIQKANKAHATE
jgi:hypothetical protein